MTHKCFQCEQRFESSGQLVLHMQKDHQNFVQDAKDKIDRSKEQYTRTFINTAATCPYCKVDCNTRKKLMKHLEEHKDLEPDEETAELKIIRITNESKTSLLDTFDGPKAGPSGSATAPVTSNSSPNFVQNLIRAAMENDPAKIASSKIKVSSTSLKLPERRYKCFWCDTSFRKRGKLMDHIDMFHKASKDQSELEAGLLQGASGSPSMHEPEKPKPSAAKHSISSSPQSAQTFSSPNIKHSCGMKEATTARSKSCEKPPTQHALNKPKRKSCVFQVIGSLRERSKPASDPKAARSNTCKFYLGCSGKLPPEKPSEPNRSSSPANNVDQGIPSSQFSPSQLLQLRSASISSNSSQQQPSPQTPLVPAVIPNFQLRDVHAVTNPFRSNTQLSARSQQLAQSLFSNMPYCVPPADLYLNQQHNLMIEQQRSQLQYLSYMQSIVSQSTNDPNCPLDLSKAK